jgi:lipid A 3-O-deacylase
MYLLLVVALVLPTIVSTTQAADRSHRRVIPLPPPLHSASKLVSEVRLGTTAQDPNSPESGSANLTGEILLVPPLATGDSVIDLLIPRFHVGASLNLNGNTSFGYAGLTWTFSMTPTTFVEGSFGGAIHNGRTDPLDDHHSALGCTALFRESGSVGVRIAEHWTVMVTVEHLSNAGLCSSNRGITNFGMKAGYAF